MDELVYAALRKWPDVPACRGWLGLDARGDWYLRDERTQAAGVFPAVKGSRIEHEQLLGFIGRNYAAADTGCWFFQNGPQRVYVELEAAPWVWRVQQGVGDAPCVVSHTGCDAAVQSAWTDEHGRLFLVTDIGLGIVHTLDMDDAATAIEGGVWQPQPLDLAALAARFGVVLSPQAAHDRV